MPGPSAVNVVLGFGALAKTDEPSSKIGESSRNPKSRSFPNYKNGTDRRESCGASILELGSIAFLTPPRELLVTFGGTKVTRGGLKGRPKKSLKTVFEE
jgi:hypothetical protein